MRCAPDELTEREAKELAPGDKVMCIDFREKHNGYYYDDPVERFDGQIVTVVDVDSSGGLKIKEFESRAHYIPRCFRLLIDDMIPEIDTDTFGTIFA